MDPPCREGSSGGWQRGWARQVERGARGVRGQPRIEKTHRGDGKIGATEASQEGMARSCREGAQRGWQLCSNLDAYNRGWAALVGRLIAPPVIVME